MSVQGASQWLASKQDKIPALDSHHRAALDILNNPIKPLADLAAIIMLDPGMSAALFHRANEMLKAVDRPGVVTIRGALGLFSNTAISDFVKQRKKLTENHADFAVQQSYQQLIARQYHMMAHLDQFIALQGLRSVNDTRCAARLFHIGELFACLSEHQRYLHYQSSLLQSEDAEASTNEIYGFSFRELGIALARKYHLPDLVVESLDYEAEAGLKSQLIRLASSIVIEAEKGWYHAKMKERQLECAEFLQQDPDSFARRLQQTAISSARVCPLKDVTHAAARLIMLPARTGKLQSAPPTSPKADTNADASKKVDKISPASTTEPPGFERKIKTLLVSPGFTQSRLLDCLLTHLHDELALSRVGLILFNRDKSQLVLRAHRGIDEHTSFKKLAVETAKSGLLKPLLAKPQALWIKPENYNKYEKIIPANFKISVQCDQFYIMSLMVAGKPVGLVYADRKPSKTDLDQATYSQFKSAVLLTSKAFALLLKRSNQKAA